MNLVEDSDTKEGVDLDEEYGDGFGGENDARYHSHEDEEQVNCIVQHVPCSAKQPSQRNNIFRS